MRSARRNEGMTLLEILVVVAIGAFGRADWRVNETR
jgi:prepilin-type N-terminal cleavage/methylation domain-containing protein